MPEHLEADRRAGDTAAVIIAVLLVLAGLKWSVRITMPLGFAIFLIALCWPIHEFLNRRVSAHLSFAGAATALLVILAIFVGALWFTGQSVAEGLPQYQDELRQLLGRARQWLSGHGLPAPQDILQQEAQGALAKRLAAEIWTVSGMILFILALAILGLPAVAQIHHGVVRLWDHRGTGHDLLATSRSAAGKVQSYVVTATVTSAITGVLSGLLALLAGLDFAFLWALLAFVLNYIPTAGSVIAVIPPTLFAFLQFDGLLMPLVVLLGLSLIQIVMGSFVYPTIAGRNLQVLPVVLLFGLGFWSFIWGIPGALLATPLTVTIMIVLREFDATRWISELLSEEPAAQAKTPALLEKIKQVLPTRT